MRSPDPFQFGRDRTGQYWEVTGYTEIERLGNATGTVTIIPWTLYFPVDQGIPTQDIVENFADQAGEEFLEFIRDSDPKRSAEFGDIVNHVVVSVTLVDR